MCRLLCEVFILRGKIPGNGIARPCGKYMFHFIKLFHSGVSKQLYNFAFPPAKNEIPIVVDIVSFVCLLKI